MKNVFGYKEIKNASRMSCDGAHFVGQKASGQLKRDLEKFAREGESTLEGAQLPSWLGLVKTLALLGFAIVLLASFKNLGELSISEMYHNAPVVFIIGVVCLAVWFVLYLLEKSIMKKAGESGELEKLSSRAEDLKARSEAELGIPHNAPEVDVLSFVYTEKDGEIKVKKQMLYTYENNIMRLFRDGDKLCLANMTEVYEFPIDGFEKYLLKKKSVDMGFWNKKEKHNKGRYKEFKVKVNEYGVVTSKYCAAQFNSGSKDYEIFFPTYELDTFRRILDLPVDVE